MNGAVQSEDLDVRTLDTSLILGDSLAIGPVSPTMISPNYIRYDSTAFSKIKYMYSIDRPKSNNKSMSPFNLATCARPNILDLQPYRCARE